MALNFPVNPATNDTYISPDGKTYSFDGVKWIYKPEGVGTNVIISSVPPDSANDGQLWYNSESGQLFVYYNDGTSNQWVGAVPEIGTDLPDQTGANGKFLRTGGSGIYWDYSVRPVVYAPSLTVTGTEAEYGYDPTQPVTVSTSAFSVSATSNVHAYTDWWFVDWQGETVFESKNDTVNLTEFTIPGNTISNTFTCYAVHVNDLGVKSISSSIVIRFGLAATGGTITTEGGFVYHTFTESGVFEVDHRGECEILVVGGGGGGGIGFNRDACGGGGGGGGAKIESITLEPGTFTVLVGAGGVSTVCERLDGNCRAGNGFDSSFGSIVMNGGGGGGTFTRSGNNVMSGVANGNSSASGDGGAGTTTTAGTPGGLYGSAGGGHSGTAQSNGSTASGGGGGAGGPGGTGVANVKAGDGGIGIQFGSSYYAGGGAGGAGRNITTAALGGLGGGANANVQPSEGNDGAMNTGGGGSGGSQGTTTPSKGGNGGSGIVIIRYHG